MKKICITGVSNGIGKAIAKLCLENGHKVIGCDIDDKGINEMTKEYGEMFVGYVGDISNFQEVEKIWNNIQERDKMVDVLINNAGVYLGMNLLSYTPTQIDKVIDINIKGSLYFSQFFGKLLLSNNHPGVIINISSISGQEGSSDAVYGTTKAGLIGLTKSCALSFAPLIRVNAIAPGIVQTGMIQAIPQNRIEKYTETELIKDKIDANDIAQTVLFLIGSGGKHYTGATFDINNGCYIR